MRLVRYGNAACRVVDVGRRGELGGHKFIYTVEALGVEI